MENLTHELNILSRAVSYKNISAAAENIGLSQPQISRIVAKLEAELDTLLLDRGSRRGSTWTKMAHEISHLYRERMRKMSTDIQQTITSSQPKFLKLATLEGLIPLASDFSHKVLKCCALEGLELNVYDLSELEELFSKQEIDLAFTSREPGKKKYSLKKLIGYQTMDKIAQKEPFNILSTYEFNTLGKNLGKESQYQQIVSNSLAVRKIWMEKFGGSGFIHSDVLPKKHKTKASQPVLLLAQDEFSPQLWGEINEI